MKFPLDMQEKQALAQLRDAQLFVSLSHLENSESASRPNSINLTDPVNLEWSVTETKPTGDEPASTCPGSGWVYFAGVCPAGCSDQESDTVSLQCPPVSTGGTRVTASSQTAQLKLRGSEVT